MVRLDIHEVFVWYITLSTFIIKEENWLEYVKSVTRNDERKGSEWVLLFHLSHLFIYVPLLKKLFNPGGTGDVKDGNDPENHLPTIIYLLYQSHWRIPKFNIQYWINCLSIWLVTVNICLMSQSHPTMATLKSGSIASNHHSSLSLLSSPWSLFSSFY